jgi:hypothetical protein
LFFGRNAFLPVSGAEFVAMKHGIEKL